MSRKRPKSNTAEHKMAAALDEQAEYDRFREEILPLYREARKNNWSPDKLLSHPKAQAMVAARLLAIATQDKDPARALTALKDILDRTVGKPKEKLEVTNKLQKLSDQELDAMLQTQLQEFPEEEEDETLQ